MTGFIKKISVDVHDVDINGVCKASSLMKYIQSAAQDQLTENGLSYDELKRRNKAFILSRIKLEFSEPIYAYDMLDAITFPCPSRGFSFFRCYQLVKENKTVGKAISVWALIDTESRSLVKVADFDLGLDLYDPIEDLTIGYFRMPTELTEVGKYTVCYGDLDQNKHVNNTKYADIFSNFLPLNNARIDSLSISYQNEARHDQTLKVMLAKCDDIYYIRTVLPDGKINSEAQIHITSL